MKRILFTNDLNLISDQEIRDNYRQFTKLLITKGLTITSMESATSGQIASLITDTEGSSAVLKGADITYSNEGKVKRGVPAKIIEEYGVYSEQTASAMAENALKNWNADFSIGVTGSMGNVDPVNMDSVPGQVYFAIGHKENDNLSVLTFFVEIPPQSSRLRYKLVTAEVIRRELAAILEAWPFRNYPWISGGKIR